jgi:NAD(P)-dependent dehydrogenase (short-subunit alcohol dehydrogenase family)
MTRMGKVKVALVTGVAGGIGHATAQLLSSEGWYVVGIDLPANLDLAGVDSYIAADLANSEQIAKAIQKLLQITDRLDVLVNNAAIQVCKPILEMDITEWDQIMAVNVRSAFLLAQATHPLLKNCQGNIVNVSSVHAIATSANIAAYATSKGAIVAFTRALAIEFASDQIRVNAILPGATDTSMLEAGLARGHLSGTAIHDLKKELSQKTVLGRIGHPYEIAQAILFLADFQRSAFMTGQSIVVDGGATARLSTE